MGLLNSQKGRYIWQTASWMWCACTGIFIKECNIIYVILETFFLCYKFIFKMLNICIKVIFYLYYWKKQKTKMAWVSSGTEVSFRHFSTHACPFLLVAFLIGLYFRPRLSCSFSTKFIMGYFLLFVFLFSLYYIKKNHLSFRSGAKN